MSKKSEYEPRNLSTLEHIELKKKFRTLKLSHVPPKLLVELEDVEFNYNETNRMSDNKLKWVNELYDEYR